ncbi:uncharacterized protein MELLADRAFT_93432 [Melampsora larici-populina 98AG31]|uniref:RNase H type-1 domain-containing protein n=1 Tax=Melampsora larici-populina (strain 98AG31 / pathotype 3-4-7) TaxID=747676 RepID=F4RAD1_MELLP|nr:uncharacterized protein MELLADRAFT_93432 [Melampsora larici-populina 98AG31]EGG10461.1 hypothetical protein MELLADRAFT_93432 [Melampsora larici-populina 98AG31]
MQNDSALSVNKIYKANSATSKFEKLDALLFQYDKAGRSNSISMRRLRDQFATIIPPTNDTLENFTFNFSVFARAAIELDSRANRPLWKMVGENHKWPSTAKELMDAEPAVLLTGCIFKHPNSDEFRYSVLDRQWTTRGAMSALLVVPVQVAGKGYRGAPDAVDPPALDPQGAGSRRTAHIGEEVDLLALRVVPATHQRVQDAQTGTQEKTGTPPPVLRLEAPAVRLAFRLKEIDMRAQLDNRLSRCPGRPDKGKSRYVSPSPDPPASSSNLDTAFQKFIRSINKPEKKLAFQTDDNSLRDSRFPPVAKAIRKIKNEYKENIKRINDSKDLEFDEKVKGVPIDNMVHWVDLITLLRQAYQAAFPPARENVEKYLDHLLKQAGKTSRGIHWKDPGSTSGTGPTKSYTALKANTSSVRSAGLEKTQISQNRLQATPNKRKNRLLPPFQSPKSNPHLRPLVRESILDTKSKMLDFGILATSLVTTGMLIYAKSWTMTATEDITYATKWDVTSIIEESRPTHRANGRKFLRGLELEEEASHYSASVEFSITADPLPAAPPLSSDPLAAFAIKKNPHLFKIICPIKTSRLRLMTKSHPNQPFIHYWDLENADTIFFCDACPTGIGIWNPRTYKTWNLTLPPPSRDIYWAELLAVVLAIDLSQRHDTKKVLIFTDNKSVCYLFSSHSPTDSVRVLFRHAVTIMLQHSVDVTFRHVAGERNAIADALSRKKLIPTSEAPPSRSHITLPAIPTNLDGGICQQK